MTRRILYVTHKLGRWILEEEGVGEIIAMHSTKWQAAMDGQERALALEELGQSVQLKIHDRSGSIEAEREFG